MAEQFLGERDIQMINQELIHIRYRMEALTHNTLFPGDMIGNNVSREQVFNEIREMTLRMLYLESSVIAPTLHNAMPTQGGKNRKRMNQTKKRKQKQKK